MWLVAAVVTHLTTVSFLQLARNSDLVLSDHLRKYPDIFFVKKANASYFAFLCVIYMTGVCLTENELRISRS
jgi:hypothetical protein